MDYITTTDLRTKSTELVEALEAGQSVKLVHRSKIVGLVSPLYGQEVRPFNAEKFKQFLKGLKPSENLSDEERDNRYREAMEVKHGKSVS